MPNPTRWFFDSDIEKLAERLDELEANLTPKPGGPKLPNTLDAKNGIGAVRGAIDLYRQGKDLEGTAQVFAAIGSFSTFVAGFETFLGPAGAILGIVSGVISAIMSAIVGPQTDSMLAKIGQMFVDQSLKDELPRLEAADATWNVIQTDIDGYARKRAANGDLVWPWEELSPKLQWEAEYTELNTALFKLAQTQGDYSAAWMPLLQASAQLCGRLFTSFQQLGGLVEADDVETYQEQLRNLSATLAERLAAVYHAAQNNARYYALDTSGSLRTRIGGVGSGTPDWDDVGGYSTSFAVSRRGTFFTTGTRWSDARPTLYVGRGGKWEMAPTAMLDATQVCIAEPPYSDTLLVAAINPRFPVVPGGDVGAPVTVMVQVFNDAPGTGEPDPEEWTPNAQRWGDRDIFAAPGRKRIQRLGARPDGDAYLLHALCWNDDGSLTLSAARFVPGWNKDGNSPAWSDVTTVSSSFVSKYLTDRGLGTLYRERIPASISYLIDGSVVLHVGFGVWFVKPGQTRPTSDPDWNLLKYIGDAGMTITADQTPHNFVFFSDMTSALLTDSGVYVRYWDRVANDFRWHQDLGAEGPAIQKQSYDEFPTFQDLYARLKKAGEGGTVRSAQAAAPALAAA
ncbi:MAG TPA: hypothetical protein VF771_17950 [Longimicrobiaceae bacterium]